MQVVLKELKEATQALTVLYVEDDLSIQKSMRKYLEKFFASVHVAGDGVEGLEQFSEESFDIVITDLSMPNMDGIEMIQQIKNLKPSQSILITTAHVDTNYLLDALKLHIDGYIVKPFDFESLNIELLKIASKINSAKENREYREYLKEMLIEKTAQMSDNYEQTLYSMVEMIESRDTYTAGHSKRVAEYSKLIAEEMGYSEEECTEIYQAGILHDIGKIATPDSVLLNPQKLNDLEYKLIQEHVTVGYKLLSHLPMFQSLGEIIYAHHERYDGQGYPRGLKKDAIPPLSRIMIVADAFDAMTTSRIYKARKSLEEALKEIEDLSGVQFHPEVAQAAIKVLRKIKIDANINQLPHTLIEKERFAYFYKDTLCGVYNEHYLDVVLSKNAYEKHYNHLHVFYINNFSQYNAKYNWERGNEILKSFATLLKEHFNTEMIFRIYGDDFCVLCVDRYDHTFLESAIETLFKDSPLSYTSKYVDLKKRKIKSFREVGEL